MWLWWTSLLIGKNGVLAVKLPWMSSGDTTSKATSGSSAPRNGDRHKHYFVIFMFVCLKEDTKSDQFIWRWFVTVSMSQSIPQYFYRLEESCRILKAWIHTTDTPWTSVREYAMRRTLSSQVLEDRFCHKSDHPGACWLASCKATLLGDLGASDGLWNSSMCSVRTCWSFGGGQFYFTMAKCQSTHPTQRNEYKSWTDFCILCSGCHRVDGALNRSISLSPSITWISVLSFLFCIDLPKPEEVRAWMDPPWPSRQASYWKLHTSRVPLISRLCQVWSRCSSYSNGRWTKLRRASQGTKPIG